MTDDIRALTARMAEEPGSLAFLELAEALRRRGQLDAAYKVARGGLARYPGLADAHDLMARVLSDQGDLAGAFDAWSSALQLDPMRAERAQGHRVPLLSRRTTAAAALDHLQRALDVDPDDPLDPQALARIAGEERVRRGGAAAARRASGGAAADAAGPHARRPDPGSSTASRAANAACCWSTPTGSGSAAELRVAGRRGGRRPRRGAARRRLAGSGARHPPARARRPGTPSRSSRPTATWCSRAPTADTVLLAAREPSLPLARVSLLAERAARAARSWLEGQ